LHRFEIDRVSDTDVQETLEAEMVALGVPELHAVTVMLEGVVGALAGAEMMTEDRIAAANVIRVN
jgi:hypothetical protein